MKHSEAIDLLQSILLQEINMDDVIGLDDCSRILYRIEKELKMLPPERKKLQESRIVTFVNGRQLIEKEETYYLVNEWETE